jgi:uncharacterized membrane protein YfhO
VLRFVEEKRGDFKQAIFLVANLAMLSLLGVAIGGVFAINNALYILESPRTSGDDSLVNMLIKQPILGISDQLQLLSSLLRLFSSDAMGSGSNFKGWSNYLESPLSYCGLITLLLIPHVFVNATERQRILYGIVLCTCIVPHVFPFFRYAFWAFSGDYYRGMSLFVILSFIYLMVRALQGIEQQHGKLNKTTLGATFGILMLTVIIVTSRFSLYTDRLIMAIVSIFLVLYLPLLLALRSPQFQGIIKCVLIGVVTIELVVLSWFTVNRRDMLTAADINSKIGYNDYSNEAITLIKSRDKDFYRINKDFSSASDWGWFSYNDAKYQNYYGTASYVSFNQREYIMFLKEVGIVKNSLEVRWSIGFLQRPLLQIFSSTKYHLTKQTYKSLSGYEFLSKQGDVSILKLKHNLPLGFTYDTYIPHREFSKLPIEIKDKILLKAVVLDDSDKNTTEQLQKYLQLLPEIDTAQARTLSLEELSLDVSARKKNALALSFHSHNILRGSITLDQTKMLFFSIPYDTGWQLNIDGRPAKFYKVNIGFMGVMLEPGEHTIELRYRPPFLIAGIIVSMLGCAVFVSLIFTFRPQAQA